MEFKLRPIPVDHARGWSTTINGEPQVISEITLTSKFGVLHYGLRPEGYDSWVFRENAGGGALTLPYTITDGGKLYIALVKENRPNMGKEPVWCAIGGFVDVGETHDQTQAREAHEESGLNTNRAQLLPGVNINPNRAFFVSDLGDNEGVRAYGMFVRQDQLELSGAEYVLRSSTNPLVKKGDVKFFFWKDAVRLTADALARAAIAQLLTVAH